MRLKWSGFLIVGIVAANLFSVSPVFAQKDMGIRAGVSIDPEQFYFGGHITTGPVVDRLFFRPNAEIGVGNHSSGVALNGEFAYFVPLEKRDTNAYFGGGPAVNIFSSGPSGARNTSVGPGFNFLVGVGQRRGWFAEMKIGAIDSPRFKLGVGYTFR